MTEGTDLTGAVTWLEALAARGISTRLVHGRIRHFPASAYRLLSSDDKVFIHEHRAAVRAALTDRSYDAGPPVLTAAASTTDNAASTLVPAPPPCKSCNRAPCIGIEHEAFEELHPERPETIERQDRRATLEMLRQLPLGAPDWYR